MRTRQTHLVSAVFINLATFLPRKLVFIGTIVTLLLATFFCRYSSCSASLEVFNDLVVDTESAARESLGILETNFIIEANHSLARLSLHNCRRDHRILSTTPWYIYLFAFLRLLWSIRAASHAARRLLNKIQSKEEPEVRRRLQGDVERTASSPETWAPNLWFDPRDRISALIMIR
ncbi:hypothetical protein C8J56DRAFT_1033821 [Mycena floridula]|nr:hypothetical protein C8J56DRAFT_1033821 [Mycena floridula]